ncbi:receptor-type tyrosine-protein phosphatase S-like [Anopheles nili]|uniref:receptor-type tyrosine-protein phosphatase S-like n=1 Tax=Anopheles nili TaxID=185578 RepID=UPI00237B0E49|nr:receptor-type tyrosine-protein phosphatase S-like [Anopheles nili]
MAPTGLTGGCISSSGGWWMRVAAVLLIISCLYNPSVKAQQRPKITEHPKDAVAAKDEPLTLNCKATGRPPPEFIWYQNGVPLSPSDRRVILPEGSLFFLRVTQNKREQDAGVYHCEARNSAGVAISENATLQIAVLRDDFRLMPKDTVALVGGPVVLNCTPPRGIPEPSVLWIKDGKILDINGKHHSLVDSGSLMISEIQPGDSGKYECSAQSMAGTKTTPPAYLKVLAPPTIVKSPHDTEVLEGEGFDLPCLLDGDPKPVVTWRKESGRLPEGRSRKLLDNTLRIEDARQEDEGKYFCEGYNEGGNVTISVYLYVYEAPTFMEAPVDVVIREGEPLVLPCRAKGRPGVRIFWDRIDRKHVDNNDVLQRDESSEHSTPGSAEGSSRRKRRATGWGAPEGYAFAPEVASFVANGSGDGGAGRGNWSIKIEPVSERQLLRQYPTRVSTLLADSSDRSRMLLRTRRDSPMEDDHQQQHHVDGTLSPDGGTGTLAAPTTHPHSSSEIVFEENGSLSFRQMSKGDEGWYACAAINEAGSIVKKIHIKVLVEGEALSERRDPISEYEQHRWVNHQQFIVLNNVFTVSATSIGITWDVTDSTSRMQLRMYYRVVSKPVDYYLYNSTFSSVLTTSNLKELTLSGLRPYSEYEIFASIPEGLAGSVSNVRRGRTLDGAPTAPPIDVRVGVINTTAAFVRWSPPPVHMLNGELTGYKIQIKSNATNKVLGQMSLNSSTQSVVINSLTPGAMYIARVASLTAGGIGPYSSPTSLHMDPQNIVRSDPTPSYWTASWMSGTVIVVLCAALISAAIFAIFWTVRKKQSVKASYPGPSVTTIIPDKQHTLWLHGNTLVKAPSHSLDPPSTSEYAELTNNTIPSQTMGKMMMGGGSIPPEPYATVTLQRGGMMTLGGLGGLNGPNGGGGMGPTLSEESCLKCSNGNSPASSNDYNAPMREPINISDMLPPPPDHPYGTYRPPNNMTIRTNPAALSPQMMRKNGSGVSQGNGQPRWDTLPPPIPSFPQNWIRPHPHQQQQHHHPDMYNNVNAPENDYESGSVLYEQCYRTGPPSSGGASAGGGSAMTDPMLIGGNIEFFSQAGEPTEEFYRNVNQEFSDDMGFEPASPPAPCPESIPFTGGNAGKYLGSSSSESPMMTARRHNNNGRGGYAGHHMQMQHQQHQMQHQQQQQQHHGQNSVEHSSDDSDCDCGNGSNEGRWVPRNKPRSRSRSKSTDRKYNRNLIR